MKKEKTRFLAVIDPTRIDQWALQKAISMAKDRDDAKVYALLCAHSEAKCDDPEELRTVELRRHTIWLDEFIASVNDAGVDIEAFVEWHENWREAICNVASVNRIDMVIKRASGRPGSLASSDRQLIRLLKSALLLVKHDPSRDLQKVLVAVDFNASDEDHAALNDAIIDLGSRIRGSSDTIELHAVSAYPDSDKFVHPPDVAKKLNIDRSQAHVRQGKAGDIIPGLANKIGADLVIVGNVGRRGLSGITVGNTSEKILTDIQSDVLVLVREESIERSAA
ncbi:MAG: universal stress protein [Proteobacteria bacterium]|nr:universal stress protein [Pseudomonadota bacterium]